MFRNLVGPGTNGPAVWFKAVGEPNLREFPISVTLSSLFPGFVPTVIATRPIWNGWLTIEFIGQPLDELHDARAWERAAGTLAELQIESFGRIEELLKAECRDLRVTSLLTFVDPFTEVMSLLMEQQHKTPPPILSAKQLETLGAQAKDVLSAWAQLNVPDTLGHLDFNPGNILCSANQCVLLDWAEAYLGPPFLTFEYLQTHFMRRRQETGVDAEVENAYHAKWHTVLSAKTISAARELVPVLAVFAFAVGTAAWHRPAMLQQPKVAAYLRSLTRKMQVEMQRLQERRHTCRN
jgi:hypothetical protein